MQSAYASGFLYVGALALVKLSICLYLGALTPVRVHRTIILGLGVLIGLWATTCFFVIGFQCQLPHSWEFMRGKCISLVDFWTSAHVLNILTDIALIALPCTILSRLQVRARRKTVIISCFVARLV